MKTILLIGAGAAAKVFAKKWDLLNEFRNTRLHISSRTIKKCEIIKKELKNKIIISKIDANKTEEVVKEIKKINATLVVNLALPYQNLSIMEACLNTQVHYLDTANYEPPNEAKYSYKWQWEYNEKFKDKGIFALLGCGFDPGVTGVYTAYASKHYFDVIEELEILDCNAGDHGHPFATNFNPEINIREITQKGKYFENNKWVETEPLSIMKEFKFPEIGIKEAYLMYHEELESITKHFPTIKKASFWMTFSKSYLQHLEVLENIGITAINPIKHKGEDIIPIEFLKTLLPDPASLAKNYTGKICIGCKIKGYKNEKETELLIYNVSDHKKCYDEVQSQAISYTTGIPALLGTHLILEEKWINKGVYNIEQLDPDIFMNKIGKFGLPWKIKSL